MFFNTFAVVAVFAGIIVSGYKYEIQDRDEEIAIPCPEYPNNFFDAWVTGPVNVTTLPDENSHIKGDVTIIFDFEPTKQYPILIEFLKRERGAWQRTIYTIKRDDFCTSLFSPSEIWAGFIKNVPAEHRVCPFQKGQVFPLDLVIEQAAEAQSGSMEGDYWVRFTIGDKDNLDEFLCTDVYFTAYRV